MRSPLGAVDLLNLLEKLTIRYENLQLSCIYITHRFIRDWQFHFTVYKRCTLWRQPLASYMHTSQAIVTSDIFHNVLNDLSEYLARMLTS